MRSAKPSRSRSARCQTCSTGEKPPSGPGALASPGVSDANDASRKSFIEARVRSASWRSSGVSFMYCMVLPHRSEVAPERLEAVGAAEQRREVRGVDDQDITGSLACGRHPEQGVEIDIAGGRKRVRPVGVDRLARQDVNRARSRRRDAVMRQVKMKAEVRDTAQKAQFVEVLGFLERQG